jgi:histidyl-tRNA synthetase
MDFIEIEGTTDEKLQKLNELNIKNEEFEKGLDELTQVVKYVRIFGIPEANFKVDLTIARGLDYYTGTVYETFLNQYRELGSVCSGGRYENLAEYYTDKQLPGVGISIGLTRLFYKLNELQLIKAEKKSIAEVLVVPMVQDLTVPIQIATDLRKKGISTEVYLNDKKIKAKMKYADKLEIPYVIVVGEDEINSGIVKIKNMKTGEEKETSIQNIEL